MTETSTVLLQSHDKYYIYKDKENSNLIAIRYENTNTQSDKEYDYLVTIYEITSVDDNIEYIDDISSCEIYYEYENGKYSLENKYSFNEVEGYKQYEVYKNNSLFSTKYIFEIK